jgi:5-methylcytosine-specific restriction endonuclease McrA
MAIIGDLTLCADYALAFQYSNTVWLFNDRRNYYAASAITDLYYHSRKVDYLSLSLLLRAYEQRYSYPLIFSDSVASEKEYIRRCRYASNSVSHLNRRIAYNEYLNSPHWHLVRAAAIVKADCRCQLCNSPDNLQVHHRTYERRGKEKLSDVTVLCRDCHRKFHGLSSD